MRLFNHTLEISLSSLRPWTHCKLHNRKALKYKHLVWGKLSILWGQPHLAEMHVCAECYEEIQLVGNDYLSFCEGCQSIEGSTKYITVEEWEQYHG